MVIAPGLAGAGQQSQINLLLTLFLSRPFCPHSARFSERGSQIQTETLVSAPQREPGSRRTRSSARLIFVGFQRCFRTRS